MDRRVGVWIWDLRIWFGCWGRCAPGRKKLGNFDWGKRFTKGTVGTVLKGRSYCLGPYRLTLGRMRAVQPTNPSQRERSDADPRPCPVLKGRGLGLESVLLL